MGKIPKVLLLCIVALVTSCSTDLINVNPKNFRTINLAEIKFEYQSFDLSIPLYPQPGVGHTIVSEATVKTELNAEAENLGTTLSVSQIPIPLESDSIAVLRVNYLSG